MAGLGDYLDKAAGKRAPGAAETSVSPGRHAYRAFCDAHGLKPEDEDEGYAAFCSAVCEAMGHGEEDGEMVVDIAIGGRK